MEKYKLSRTDCQEINTSLKIDKCLLSPDQITRHNLIIAFLRASGYRVTCKGRKPGLRIRPLQREFAAIGGRKAAA